MKDNKYYIMLNKLFTKRESGEPKTIFEKGLSFLPVIIILTIYIFFKFDKDFYLLLPIVIYLLMIFCFNFGFYMMKNLFENLNLLFNDNSKHITQKMELFGSSIILLGFGLMMLIAGISMFSYLIKFYIEFLN